MIGKIKLGFSHLSNSGINISLIATMLGSLPEGSKLMQISQDESTTIFFIENELFTKNGEIIATFHREVSVIDGKVKEFDVFGGLDYSDVKNHGY